MYLTTLRRRYRCARIALRHFHCALLASLTCGAARGTVALVRRFALLPLCRAAHALLCALASRASARICALHLMVYSEWCAGACFAAVAADGRLCESAASAAGKSATRHSGRHRAGEKE